MGQHNRKSPRGNLAHWESHFTNTCIEELNSVFSATKRKAEAITPLKKLITMLHFAVGKLNIPSAMYH